MADDRAASDGPARTVGGQPRDALFRVVLGQPEHAASQLRSVLPAAVAARVDWASLVPVPGTFVDSELKRRHTDALFTAHLLGEQAGRQQAYLYVLIEHQSEPDPVMAWRMLRYQDRIWERHLLHDKQAAYPIQLPAILPVVIYAGQRRWNAATDLADLIDLDADTAAALGELVPRLHYLLDDVSRLTAAQLRARPLTAAARLTMVLLGLAAGHPNVTVELTDWLDQFTEVWTGANGKAILESAIVYLYQVSDTPSQELNRFFSELGPDIKDVAMSTAEKLHAEGHAKGRLEGRAEGHAEGQAKGRVEGQSEGAANVLTRLLTTRFGPLPQAVVARLRAGTEADHLRWTERVLSAPTLGAIFGDEPDSMA